MALPTLEMNFGDIILRVAESLGIAYHGADGTEDAQVPVLASDLSECKRIVNDGWRRFIGIRQNWNWMKPSFEITLAIATESTVTSATSTTVVDSTIAGSFADDAYNGWTINIISGTGAGQLRTITDFTGISGTFTSLAWTTTPDSTSGFSYAPPQCVGGDDSRYYMPDGYYGRSMGELNYINTQGTSRIQMTFVDPTFIRRLYSDTVTTADPSVGAILPLTGTDAGRFELWMWPRPSAALTLRGQCEIYPNEMVELTDVPNCGFQFHRAVLQASLFEAVMKKDPENIARVESLRAEWGMAATEATIWDKENSPSRIGLVDGGLSARRGWYQGIDTYTTDNGSGQIINL